MNNTYYKIIGNNYGHFNYHLGLNTLEENGETFDDSKCCGPGGLYYTIKDNIWSWLDHGNQICQVTIPDDAQQVGLSGNLFKSDKIIIHEIRDITIQTISDWDLPPIQLYDICQYGYVEMLEEQFKNDGTVLCSITRCINVAAGHGQLKILDVLWDKCKEYSVDFYYTSKAIDDVQLHVLIDVLDWFFDKHIHHGLPLYYTYMCVNFSASHGKMDVLEWWLDKFIHHGIEFKYTDSALLYASRNGCVCVLDWFLEQHVRYHIKFEHDETRIKVNSHRFTPDARVWWENFFKNKSKIIHTIKVKYNIPRQDCLSKCTLM